jgi:predicted alpha/beta-hydrolase family hydrolase
MEPVDVSAPDRPAVRGVLHRAAEPGGDALVLTHGAGGNAATPLLVDVAHAFVAGGVTVLRCDLPFRQARPGGPPSPRGAATDRAGLEHAVAVVRQAGARRVFLGGLSYGGRQASMLAADLPGLVAGLLLLSYPLHPPSRPADLRVEHFPRITAPALFVHGTRDPFGSPQALEAARASIPAATALVLVEGGHDLGYARRAARDPGLPARIVAAFRALVG